MARISVPLMTISFLWCLPVVTHSFSPSTSPRTAFRKLNKDDGSRIHHRRFVLPASTSKNTNRPSSFSIQFRPATIQDLDLILKWDEQDHMQDEEKMGDAEYNDWNWEYELGREANVEWRDILIAEYQEESDCNSTPVGIVQVLDPSREETLYWGNDGTNPEYIAEFCRPELRAVDIWIGDPDFIGRGIGSRMMQLALRNYCFDDPNVDAVLVDPMATHDGAIRFYQNKCGFEPVGLRTFGPDKCLVHRLDRKKWESGPLAAG